MKLHEKIIVYRKKCGLSQETLAEKIGVSRQAVSKWETGDALPEITKLKALADCFGVTVDFLLDENADEYKPQSNVKLTGFDRVVDGVGDLAEKLVLYLKNHSWIVGVVTILIGVSIALRGLMEFLPAVNFLQFGFPGIAVVLVLGIGTVYIVVGVFLVVCGIKIIKKTKKK